MASIPRSSLSSNSSYFLTRLRSALATRFPNTGVRTSCPAIVVPFGADASETTEVTPANYIGTKNHFETYEIPNCSGSWNESSPDAHNTYVRTNDQRLSNKVKPLIRFIKAWKYFQNVPISSFYLELRIAKYSSEEVSIYYAIDVKRIFSHLNSVNLAKIRDPMGVSGLIAPCRSEAEMLTAKSKLSTALSRATKVRTAEEAGDIAEAFDWWNKLFAYNFPNYYK